MKIVSFDIDGVLNNYPECWLLYLNNRLNFDFRSIEDAKNVLKKDLYDSIKKEYRLMGENSEFTLANHDMIKVVNSFYDAGFHVIISTSRPISSPIYPMLFNLTSQWLIDCGVQFSQLVHKDDTLTNHRHLFSKILFHIDDEMKYIKAFRDFGVSAYLFNFFDEHYSEISYEELVKLIKRKV
ncbi:hypothetical protein [Flavobacterium sp.]|uniref:hypothetical protein n=1 Tax=Flavobacterium sp. TaxID=239 RepID=UPI0033413306